MKEVLTTLTILGLAAGSALAQAADWATTDINADGMVTMEEARVAGHAWSEDEFRAADSDGNGSLSEEEFRAATQSQ